MASPGSKQAWPNSAACWSPAMPATGTAGREARRAVVVATSPQLAAPRGSDARGRRTARAARRPSAARDVEQHRPRGVGHVGDALAGQLEDQPASMVPNTARPCAPARAGRRRCRAATDLRAREVGVQHQPGRSRTSGSCPCSRSSSQSAAVRRSCQTIARCSGSPVSGSQTHDGLPLVGDPDRLELAARTPASSRPPATAWVTVPDLRGVVLHPAGPGVVLGELAVGPADSSPSPSKTRQVVPVVPCRSRGSRPGPADHRITKGEPRGGQRPAARARRGRRRRGRSPAMTISSP